jgi:hypothetical protein
MSGCFAHWQERKPESLKRRAVNHLTLVFLCLTKKTALSFRAAKTGFSRQKKDSSLHTTFLFSPCYQSLTGGKASLHKPVGNEKGGMP